MNIDEKILIKRMITDNNWWSAGLIPYYKELNKRAYYYGFNELVNQRIPHRAVILMGPRRVGKTVMMYQAIQDLIDAGTDPKKIFYFSIDTPVFTNIPLEELFLKALSIHELEADDCYVFFDEIQYLKDWEIHLKSLVDTYRKTKFTASGSAAAALRMKSRESGAGRFTDYFLPPLTFAEYIDLNAYQTLLTAAENDYYSSGKFYIGDDIKTLNRHFIDYINFGGFPELSLSKEKVKNPERVIQQDITDKVILKDLPGLFGIENTAALQQFFNVLAYRTGEIMSYKSIGKETNTDIKTIKKYLEYLEAAFLIKILYRVDVTAKRLRKITQFKIYLTNPSLYIGLFGRVDEGDERLAHLVETAVFAQYLHREHAYLRYARWDDGEVDLIQISRNMQDVEWALEVKWSNSPKSNKLSYFMNKNNLKKGIITSKEVLEQTEDILIVPNSIHAYTIGKNAFYNL